MPRQQDIGRTNMLGKAVFLDRDGVLNVDCGYPHRLEDLVLIEGSAEAVAYLKIRGYLLIVVSNQSGVARGLFDEAQVSLFHDALNKALEEKAGGKIDKFYFSPWHPEAELAAYRREHPDRKPNPGMILRAIAEYHLDPARSFLIGDKQSDLQAASAACIKSYLFQGGNLLSFVKAIVPE